nr:polysaccharide biosynthesis/export family protein [Caballeronia sp. Lep1P3]
MTAALVALLNACSFAPGWRMPVVPDAASGQATGGASATGTHIEATAATPDIPVTELSLGLAQRLTAERKSARNRRVSRLLGAPPAYTVGRGDVLQIVVWDHPEFAAALGSAQNPAASKAGDPAAGFVVDQSGNLHFPYAGALPVAGLRTEQIQARLTAALSKYLVKPQVTVRMASFRAREVYVDGEVNSPGALPVTDVPLNLYDAIARAGGLRESGDQSDLVLVRGGASYRIDLTEMLAEGLSPSQLYLKSGDLLRVTSRDENNVYVAGEVNKPGVALPRRDGRLSLADALAQAGSINSSTADTAQMFVIRAGKDAPEVFHLDSRSPVAMLVAQEFDLRPKDIVYVDGNGLVRFNRVMTLLMPLVNTGLTAGIIAK